MKELLVIIPVYNEEESIGTVIDDLKKHMGFADIIIVDDCSSDKTLDIVRNKRIKYLSLPFRLGYASVMQTGFKYAVKEDYKYVLQFDGDGQHRASEAKKIYKAIKKGEADIVIGSRFIKQTDYKHGLFRNIGTLLFRTIIFLICNKKIYDPTSGLQMISKKVVKRFAMMNNYPDYPDANLLVDLLLNDIRITEVSVEMNTRKHGVSMHSGILGPIKYIINMMYSIFIVIVKHFPFSIISIVKRRRAH